jgi:hypothetical protein
MLTQVLKIQGQLIKNTCLVLKNLTKHICLSAPNSCIKNVFSHTGETPQTLHAVTHYENMSIYIDNSFSLWNSTERIRYGISLNVTLFKST